MSDEERLQRGRARSPRPSPSPRPSSGGDPGRFARLVERRRRRKRAKKARLARMTRGRRVLRRFMIAGTWLLGLIASLMVAVIVLYYAFTDVPRPEQLALPQKATIQYSDGSTLATIGSVDRTIVHISQVPPAVRWAVLAAEDRSFYGDGAVSIRGTIRAALSDITGGSTQGGSGITQQYVKNAYLSNAQTLTRKLKELMIAVKLSREYSKDQILEFYLNTVYFGRNTYGIQAAAQAFFGENVEQLTTAQGALLAALLRAPSYYDPANNPAAAKARWYYVLDGMVKTGHLTPAQEAGLTFPKTKPPSSTNLGSTGWKYLLVNAVLADLQAHGIPEKEIYARGLTIRTTIDPKAQQAAVQAEQDVLANPTSKQHNLKSALVAVNPLNGSVLAYYGGTGPDVKGLDGKVSFYDWASQGGRPAGSSFKPYTLATALTQTLRQTPGKDHVALDSLVLGNQCEVIAGTKICNDPGDSSYSAPQVQLALAMKYSLNTTFDLLALDAGPDNVAATAHALGIAKTDSNGQPTLVDKNGQTSFGIGIGDYPVTVVDQAVGFATLANQGIANSAYLVQRATSSDGEVVYTHQAAARKAIDPKVANDVTLSLEPVAGYSGLALADGRVSASKTGTVGVGPTSSDNSDAWLVGYTPQVSAAVWVGSGSNQPIYNSDGNPMYGKNEPGQIWKQFMDSYLSGQTNQPMTSEQMIAANGQSPSSSSAPPPTSSSVPPSSSTPGKPTFSITTGFSTPSSSAHSSSSSPVSSPASTATGTPSKSSSCTAPLGLGCPP